MQTTDSELSQTLKIQIKDQFHRQLHPRNARNHNATSAINKLTLIIQKLIHDKTYKKKPWDFNAKKLQNQKIVHDKKTKNETYNKTKKKPLEF